MRKRTRRPRFLPTSWEGKLLGVVRPVWFRAIESEQRVSWLNKMVKRGLCVNDIEAYINTEHDKLRSRQLQTREEERDILVNLMKLKLKDEKRNLEGLHRSRESLRIRLKREISIPRNYSSIMKREI